MSSSASPAPPPSSSSSQKQPHPQPHPPPRPPPRLPTLSDFPAHVKLSITPPPPSNSSGPPLRSVLILLHGIGDTEEGFTRLARGLRLGGTVGIAVRASNPLPPLLALSPNPLGAYYWADDIHLSTTSSSSPSEQLDLDSGFTKSTKLLWEDVILGGLIRKCGFELRDVVIYGFGEGAMVGLGVAWGVRGYSDEERGGGEEGGRRRGEMGGVVSVGGKMPSGIGELVKGGETSKAATPSVSPTPILLLSGSRSSEITGAAIAEIKSRFGEVEYVKWSKREDSMPASREEMEPVMRFFARRLGRMRGGEFGGVEL